MKNKYIEKLYRIYRIYRKTITILFKNRNKYNLIFNLKI